MAGSTRWRPYKMRKVMATSSSAITRLVNTSQSRSITTKAKTKGTKSLLVNLSRLKKNGSQVTARQSVLPNNVIWLSAMMKRMRKTTSTTILTWPTKAAPIVMAKSMKTTKTVECVKKQVASAKIVGRLPAAVIVAPTTLASLCSSDSSMNSAVVWREQSG